MAWNGSECGKTSVMRNSRQLSPAQIMIAQQQMENVEHFNCLGTLITNYARCACDIKSRNAMVKAAFDKKKTLFTSKLELNLRKKLAKCYIWSMAFMVMKLGYFRK